MISLKKTLGYLVQRHRKMRLLIILNPKVRKNPSVPKLVPTQPGRIIAVSSFMRCTTNKKSEFPCFSSYFMIMFLFI